MGELVDLAVDNNIINKSGSWYSYGETKIGQGRESAKTWLRENPEEQATIKREVRELLGMVDLGPHGEPLETLELSENGVEA
jgi:recombination protein RecA